jgi:predicted nucleic acid-binding protein
MRDFLRILIDTMYIIDLLSDPNFEDITTKLDEGNLEGLMSVVTITELVKILGKKDEKRMRATISKLHSSKLSIIDVSWQVAQKAGEIRLKYDIPTIDSIICATGILNGAKHILTRDKDFRAVKNLIKPIDEKQLRKSF